MEFFLDLVGGGSAGGELEGVEVGLKSIPKCLIDKAMLLDAAEACEAGADDDGGKVGAVGVFDVNFGVRQRFADAGLEFEGEFGWCVHARTLG